MTAAAALAVLFGCATLLALARLILRHFRAPTRQRARPWRLMVLLALQPVTALLLYLTLDPPRSASTRGGIVVATRRAGLRDIIGTGDRIVALPEAADLPGAERVPDLGTALRRFAPARVRVVGEGLTARDRDPAPGVPITFDPPPAPGGLVRLDLPPAIAPGAVFRVSGRIGGGGATIELIDPAGRRVDAATPNAAGDFLLAATARIAGPALFMLRLRRGSAVIEDAAVPISTATDAPQRVLLLAGAPGPEVKYLRRWASDAGLAVHSEIATGAGLSLGDAPVPLTEASLEHFDLAVLDDRRWTALSPAERTALVTAVRGGLGLLIRVDDVLTPAARTALQPLGVLADTGEATAFGLAPRGDTPAEPAPDGKAPAVTNGDAAPTLTRWPARLATPDAIPLLRDARGARVAAWRAEGRGRVALWPVADTFRLVLDGRAGTYGELWSSAFGTVGRGTSRGAPAIDQHPRVEQRVAVCTIREPAVIVGPDGHSTPLLVDPATGPRACAAFWPTIPGWHQVQQRNAGGATTTTPFFVMAKDALPGLRAMADRDATLRLATMSSAVVTRPRPTRGGSSWSWFTVWLAASVLLWWFERSRFGRRPAPAESA